MKLLERICLPSRRMTGPGPDPDLARVAHEVRAREPEINWLRRRLRDAREEDHWSERIRLAYQQEAR